MIVVRRRWMAVLVATALVLSACSGSGGDVTPATVSGQVADGYIAGALVFSDQNGNNVLDPGEPVADADTDALGNYTLTGIDVDQYPVVVIVPPGASDSDGTTVDTGYVLSAPAGRPEFVSPLTTLVQQQVASNPALDVDDAADVVADELSGIQGVTGETLFTNYMEAEATDSVQEDLHQVAQVIAGTMEDMQAAIEQIDLTGTDLTAEDVAEALLPMVVDRVMEELSSISTDVADASYDPATDLNALIDSSVASIESSNPVDVNNIEQEVEVATTVPESSTWTALISEGGVHWLDFQSWDDGGVTNYDLEHGQVLPSANGTLAESQEEFDFTAAQWVDTTGQRNDMESILIEGQWVEVSDGPSAYTFQVNADGSATLSHSTLGAVEQIFITVVDLTGKKIASFLEPGLGEFLINADATFPAGAKGYAMTFIPLQTSYSVEQWMDEGVDHNSVADWNCDPAGCTDIPILTVTEAKSTFAYNNVEGKKLWLNGDLALQFDNDTIRIFDESNGQEPVELPLTGTLSLQQVQGKDLYFVDIPADYRSRTDMFDSAGEIFLVEKDGQVKWGEYLVSGTVEVEDDIEFNAAAYEAIAANLTLGN